MFLHKSALGIAVLLAGLAMPPDAPAAPHGRMLSQAPQQGYAPSAPVRSADEAVRRALGNGGGQVLSVEEAYQNGVTEYRIKMLTPEGRVRVIRMRGAGASESDRGRGRKD